jgi:hypothetical protein
MLDLVGGTTVRSLATAFERGLNHLMSKLALNSGLLGPLSLRNQRVKKKTLSYLVFYFIIENFLILQMIIIIKNVNFWQFHKI